MEKTMNPNTPNKKPILRGHLHQSAFFMCVGACALLIAKSTNDASLVASITFSFSLFLMFGISTIYHRIHWSPSIRAIWKRLDHSAIFILIAGSATPLCLLALPEKVGQQFLLIIWLAALAGVLQSIFWVRAPKYATALFYIITGWLAAPYISDLKEFLGTTKLALIIGGGVVYTVGAVFYALKKPNLAPSHFGYHELFHLCTIIGAALHFIAIYQLIT